MAFLIERTFCIRAIVILALLFGPAGGPVLAVQPDEIFKDQSLEKRAREISAGLRCLVCQNQSIDDSDAPLARDLRLLVRERLLAGDSDKEVNAYVVARYGEFVLLKPPFGWHTLVLWIAPLFVLGVGVVAARRVMRGHRDPEEKSGSVVALTAEEQSQLDALLNKQDQEDTQS